MVFRADAAVAIILIAIGIGYWVITNAHKETNSIKVLGTFLGYFIIVVAFLTLLCAGYYSLRYWEDGYFNKPTVGHIGMMGDDGMMMSPMHGGGKCKMMNKMAMHKGECKMMAGEEQSDHKCDHMMKGEKGHMSGEKMMEGREHKMSHSEKKGKPE